MRLRRAVRTLRHGHQSAGLPPRGTRQGGHHPACSIRRGRPAPVRPASTRRSTRRVHDSRWHFGLLVTEGGPGGVHLHRQFRPVPQLAAAAWRRVSRIPASSAGTRPARRVHPRAVAIGRRHGLDLKHASTRQLADVHLSSPDLLVAVCDNAHEQLVMSDSRGFNAPRGCTGTCLTRFPPTLMRPSKPPTARSLSGSSACPSAALPWNAAS